MEQEVIVEIQRMQQGDFNNYQRFYDLTAAYTYGVITQIVEDAGAAANLLSETYNTAYERINDVVDYNLFYPWIGMLATDTTLRYLNTNPATSITAMEGLQDIGFGFSRASEDREPIIPANAMESANYVARIKERMETFSPIVKMVMQYFYYDNLSIPEIAFRMRVSEAQVKNCIIEIRESLRPLAGEVESDNTPYLALAELPLLLNVFRQTIGLPVLKTSVMGSVLAMTGAAAGGARAVASGVVGAGNAGVVGAGNVGMAGASNAGMAAGNMGAMSAGSVSATGAGQMGTAAMVAGKTGLGLGAKIAIAVASISVVGVGTVAVIHGLKDKDKDKNPQSVESTQALFVDEVDDQATTTAAEIPDILTTEETSKYGDDLVTDSDASAYVEDRYYPIPQINWEGNAVAEVNQELMNKYLEEISAEQQSVNNLGELGYAQEYAPGKYYWYINDDYLTLVVASSWGNNYNNQTFLDFYMLDLANDKQMTKDDVLTYYGLSADDYYNRVYDALGGNEPFTPNNPDMAAQEEQVRERTLSRENIDESRPFIGLDGHLCVMYNRYNIAGSEKTTTTIDTETKENALVIDQH